jgi:hypothetical protein
MFRNIFLCTCVVIFYTKCFSQQQIGESALPEQCLTKTESELYKLINEYRVQKGLTPVKLSASLCYVAKMHAKDQSENYKSSTRCNMHSWSKSDKWSSCCYTSDHKQAKCMWDKPRELTGYKGDGFEISFWSTYPYATPMAAADDILNGWKKSAGHNNLIINKADWKSVEWKAIGIGIYGEYANVWFGKEEDSAYTIKPCEAK